MDEEYEEDQNETLLQIDPNFRLKRERYLKKEYEQKIAFNHAKVCIPSFFLFDFFLLGIYGK